MQVLRALFSCVSLAIMYENRILGITLLRSKLKYCDKNESS